MIDSTIHQHQLSNFHETFASGYYAIGYFVQTFLLYLYRIGKGLESNQNYAPKGLNSY